MQGVHISFSPSGCIAASLDEKSHVQMRVMEHSFGLEQDGLFNDGACCMEYPKIFTEKLMGLKENS